MSRVLDIQAWHRVTTACGAAPAFNPLTVCLLLRVGFLTCLARCAVLCCCCAVLCCAVLCCAVLCVPAVTPPGFYTVPGSGTIAASVLMNASEAAAIQKVGTAHGRCCRKLPYCAASCCAVCSCSDTPRILHRAWQRLNPEVPCRLVQGRMGSSRSSERV